MLFVLDYEGINHRGTGQLFFFFFQNTRDNETYICVLTENFLMMVIMMMPFVCPNIHKM